MPSLFTLRAFLRHWLFRVDEHSIHSPYFFDFYREVIQGAERNPRPEIEALRTSLLQNKLTLTLADLGSPASLARPARTLGDITRTSLLPLPWAAMLHRLARYQKAKRIVELGTCLGLTTLYLADTPGSEVYTFEGQPALASVARTHFEAFEKRNIHLIEGLLDKTLPEFLQTPAKIDLAILDAYHEYEPTVRYFEWLAKRMADKGIVVVDDIYRDAQMEKAWHHLRAHPLTYGSVDLFRMGLLFLDPDLHRQHYTVALSRW